MKVEAISLALIASLAVVAAIPLGGGAPSVSMEREERARKDSAKLRLLEAALAHGRLDKERRPEFVHPKGHEGDQEVSESKVVVTKSESSRQAAKVNPTTITTAAPDTTTYPATTKSDFTLRLEKQRSVADQALRDRLMRHTGPQKESRGVARNSPQASPIKVHPPLQDAKDEVDSGPRPTIPPVVYVPLSEDQDSKMSGSAFRLAPYVPAVRAGARQSPWFFASYFPVLVNDPYQVLVGGGPLFEYGQDADVCRPKMPARDAIEDASSTDSEAEIAMGASGYVTKVVVRGGGVAIAGPGGVATAGRGGTAIVGPGGVAYTRPGALAVVGPGGKVMSQRNQGVYVSSRDGNSARGRSGVREDATETSTFEAPSTTQDVPEEEDGEGVTEVEGQPAGVTEEGPGQDDDEALLPPPADGIIRPIPNATVLVLRPRAHAEAGEGGRAVARPLSLAVLARKEDRIIYLPEVSAVAGPGGTAIALPELIIRKLWEQGDEGDTRLEHRGVEEFVQAIHKTAGDGEVVEASDVVSANAGEKSVAQAQPTGIATAGQGGVAVSSPQGVAVVGPGGLAIARPVAVAVAGPGADKPGIFLRPEAGQGPSDGTEEASNEGPPEVEEASEEGGDVTPPPQAMFHYLVYPQAMLIAPQQFYPGLV